MKLGDLRKMTAGLPDETELEICDENTGEVYAIHEMQAMAFEDCHTKDFDGETGFWLRLTTNVGLQTENYVLSENNYEEDV